LQVSQVVPEEQVAHTLMHWLQTDAEEAYQPFPQGLAQMVPFILYPTAQVVQPLLWS
jgi:hypothetical protein